MNNSFHPAAILYNQSGSAISASADANGNLGIHTITTISGSLAASEMTIPRSANTDAFGRLRVSEPVTLFDSKQVFDNQSLNFWSISGSNSDSVTWVSGNALTVLSCSANPGTRALRQSKRYFNYQPGKSLAVLTTFNMKGGTTGLMKRAGYFDDDNGCFFELSESTPKMRIITDSPSGSNQAVEQSSWNIDPMDGTGPSGVTLDWTKTQILWQDFEWLGVGAARTGFVVDGKLYYSHEFRNTNNLEYVYMRTPNLPVRWEITGSAAGTMESICCTVMSEGGIQPPGRLRSVNNALAGKSVGSTPVPLMGIRLKTGSYAHSPIIPKALSIMTSTGANFRWFLTLDPTLTVAPPGWTGSANSPIEYSDTHVTTLATSGTVLASGYGSTNARLADFKFENALSLYNAFGGGYGNQLWLCVDKLGGGTDTFYGAITWEELL